MFNADGLKALSLSWDLSLVVRCELEKQMPADLKGLFHIFLWWPFPLSFSTSMQPCCSSPVYAVLEHRANLTVYFDSSSLSTWCKMPVNTDRVSLRCVSHGNRALRKANDTAKVRRALLRREGLIYRVRSVISDVPMSCVIANQMGNNMLHGLGIHLVTSAKICLMKMAKKKKAIVTNFEK